MWSFLAGFSVIFVLLYVVTTTPLKESYSSGCSSGSLTDRTGSFSSPVIISEPKFYPDNTYCNWTINIPKGGNVTISFTKFNTEACCDYVKVTTDNGFLIGHYSGPRFPFKVSVRSDEAKSLDIVFKSDQSVYKAGFHANYHVYGKIATTAAPPTSPVATLAIQPPSNLGAGDSLMEAFLKMNNALSRIIQSASSNLGGDSVDDDDVLAFKSELYQAVQSVKTLKRVQSPALTKDEEGQLNFVLKRLNVASKIASKKLSKRISPLACLLPKKVGPCRAAFRRWYFDSKLDRCRTFIYGGCQANGNNFVNKESCKSLCGPKKLECPDGSNLFRCFANPCDVTSCDAYVYSRCEPNYCGGCNAEFFDQYNNSITNSCSCLKGQTPATCAVDPCRVSRCPLHPGANCRASRCGCVAEFVDDDGNILDDC